MDAIVSFFRNYVAWLTIPEFTVTDILEIIIIAYAFYHIILWIKDTRAWMLLKGMLLLGLIFLAAVLLEMNVVLWVFRNAMVVGIVALVVIFQPELRGALEQLGRKNILGTLASFDSQKAKNERYSEKSIQSIVKAVYDMARVKTGALIVVEKNIQCREYERTGIPIDSEISSQLIINIFEHNTPLHDGAVLLRDNRIVAQRTGNQAPRGTWHQRGVGFPDDYRVGGDGVCIHCFRREALPQGGRGHPAASSGGGGQTQSGREKDKVVEGEEKV